tara:strand:+ start:10600 stop:11064 length:465 start_codon:yes stop_codon:yes gene_type:complete
MTNDFRIRKAELEDVGRCVDLAKQFHATSYWGSRAFSQEKVEAYAEWVIRNPKRLVLVSENKEEIYGFFVASWNEMFFTDERVSDEEVLWVQEGSGTVWTMREFFKEWEKWAKENGCSLIFFNPTSHGELASKWNKFMGRYGYDVAGASYRKEL